MQSEKTQWACLFSSESGSRILVVAGIVCLMFSLGARAESGVSADRCRVSQGQACIDAF